MMKQLAWSVAAVAAMCSGVGQVRADIITLDPTGRGWFSPQSGNNGNASDNNYIAGSNEEPAQFRNHFDFAIPILSGMLTSAVFTLDNPDHEGGTHTYTVSALGAFGTYGYSDIGKGTTYGSVNISASGTVTITLYAAALADIEAVQGGRFSLGGVDSGEFLFPMLEYDFGFTGSGFLTTLTLTTSPTPVPEPSTLALLGMGMVSLLGYGWRRRKLAAA
jgi:hypothetical protein